jgi:hypothetical protein
MLNPIWRRGVFCLAMTIAVLLPSSTPAQDSLKVWSAIGSAGTVDESDAGEVVFTDTRATLTPVPLTPATAVIRFNVVAVDGLFADLTPTSWPALIVRYRDAGGRERVRARLQEVDLATGATHTAIVFDSDLFPQLPTYQTQAIGDCGVFSQFEFATKAYYVEVELIRSHLIGTPGLELVALSRYGVCEGYGFVNNR